MITRILAGGVIAGVIACGGLGTWAAGASPWNQSEVDRAVGVAGFLAFILALHHSPGIGAGRRRSMEAESRSTVGGRVFAKWFEDATRAMEARRGHTRTHR